MCLTEQPRQMMKLGGCVFSRAAKADDEARSCVFSKAAKTVEAGRLCV